MNQKVLFKTRTETVSKISFWNAGGLTNDKFTELKTIVLNNDLDAMGIVEGGAAADNEEYFNLTGYQKFVLKHSKQITSGIVFVKLSLKLNKQILRNEPIKKGSKKLTTDKDISSAFCGHYARVSNYRPIIKILKSDLKPQQNNSSDFQQLFNDDFNLDELRNGISTLMKGKSAGPDRILPKFLINLGD
ncbi:hypothetical protein TNCT_285491 [Trichonephila clavata]|uniref:Uncharacterized protein n=1 Tax=Trichonephila clavata TaxID=2740835 RepID=A0A8X6KR98_TRICU|nr:hypothetical protein TNCT_285491 [Trichonephila clavata]